MTSQREEQKLALQGGMKAVTRIEGKGRPKIGLEEFMSVAERFGFNDDALQRIRSAVTEEDLGDGPFLANYYSSLSETKVNAFARVSRETFGVKHAVPVSSGSAALHCAFVAAGVRPGTEVICAAIGFYATAMAVVQAKGVPVFCDVDSSLGMDPQKLEGLINERTVAISPTHVMGSVCDMEAIMDIARRHNLRVVEDCAQSCGGRFKDRLVGTWGDLGCFSISAYKIVGGGEGGLIITDDDLLMDRALCMSEGGGLWRPDRFGPERYDGELFCGGNYRMSELEAAVDVVQMTRMPQVVERFRSVKKRVVAGLKTFREIEPQRLNDPDGEVGYTLRFVPETIELGQRIAEALQAEGVGAGIRGENDPPDWHIYTDMYPLVLQRGAPEDNCPFDCHRFMQAGGKADYSPGQCPVADDLFHRMVSVSLNQWYNEQDCDNIAAAINKVLGAYCTEDPSATPWRPGA